MKRESHEENVFLEANRAVSKLKSGANYFNSGPKFNNFARSAKLQNFTKYLI